MAKRENDLGRDPIGKLLLRLAAHPVTWAWAPQIPE